MSNNLDDAFANRIYRAEEQVSMRMLPEPSMTLEEVVDFVAHVTAKEWWRRRSSFSLVLIRDGRGNSKALADVYRGSINLPRWSRTRPVVLHELTHLLTNSNRPAHSYEFAANLTDMYKQFLGERWSSSLQERLVANSVSWGKLKYKERFNIVRPVSDVPRARKPRLVR